MSVNVVIKSVFDDKGIKNAERSFKKLSSGVSKALGAVGLSLGAVALANGLNQAAKAAGEEQKSAALLERQLQNTVGANSALVASVEASIKAMSLNAAVADDQLRPAFSQLVRATQDVDTATSMLQLALDVSAGTGRDLQSVTIALSKAYQGNTTALSRLGIKAQDGVDVFAQLQEQFGGAAETAARNDPFARLSVTVGELQEQIGVYLLPLLNGLADYLSSANFGKAFQDMAVRIGLAIEAINNLFISITGNNALTFFADLIGAVSYEVTKLTILMDGLGKSFNLWLSGKWAEAIAFDPAKYIKDQIAKLDKEIKNRTASVSGSDKRLANIVSPLITDAPKAGPKQETTAERFAKVQKVIKNAQKAILRAEQDYARTRFEINRDYQDAVEALEKDAAKRQADLLRESAARLTGAFLNATRLSLGDLFDSKTTTSIETQVKKLSSTLSVSVSKEVEKTTYSSVDDIIKGLQKRLQDSRTLIERASQLSADGFSQTFIEQVIETGAQTGNELASAILSASPETRSQLRTLFNELETVSETGMDAVAKQITDKFGLATRELKIQSAIIQTELDDALIAEQKRLATALADAGYAFGLAIKDIKTQFLEDLDAFDGWFAGLGKTIDALLGKMGQLSGKALTDVQQAITAPTAGTNLAGATITQDVAVKNIRNATGIVVDSLADVAGTAAYIQARIAAAQTYIKSSSSNATQEASAKLQIENFQKELANLKGAAASGTVAGTTININVKTDTTQSQAMVGKTIGNIVTKYVTTGGQVLVSGNA
jgi:hypothetical protein